MWSLVQILHFFPNFQQTPGVSVFSFLCPFCLSGIKQVCEAQGKASHNLKPCFSYGTGCIPHPIGLEKSTLVQIGCSLFQEKGEFWRCPWQTSQSFCSHTLYLCSSSLLTVLQGCLCHLWILWEEDRQHAHFFLRGSPRLFHNTQLSRRNIQPVCSPASPRAPGCPHQCHRTLQLAEVCVHLWCWPG